MKLGEPEKKKKQESEVETWARLDIRSKRSRTRNDLALLVMGTSFLLYLYVCIVFSIRSRSFLRITLSARQSAHFTLALRT